MQDKARQDYRGNSSFSTIDSLNKNFKQVSASIFYFFIAILLKYCFLQNPINFLVFAAVLLPFLTFLIGFLFSSNLKFPLRVFRIVSILREFKKMHLKLTSYGILHYLCLSDLSKSFSQLIVPIFIFSQ